ncbi:hypothetical protein DFH07DRAFT_968785 [Mycena maculata]|uniref:Uncharacterized protein n=1 Tax=Mycena maculata TaxID=230809 RepID=A0AAD7MUP2_9AGAR|nr:hypothetical protein DFH07DRAFT_968785 [Mycena maculata]
MESEYVQEPEYDQEMHEQSSGLERVRPDGGGPAAKRRAIPGPKQDVLDNMRELVQYYKENTIESQRKAQAQAEENKRLLANLGNMQDQLSKMNDYMQENSEHNRELEKSKDTLLNHNQALCEQLRFAHGATEERTRNFTAFGQQMMAQQQQLYTALKAEKDRARELERVTAQKTDEAAALRTKLTNQALGQTPRRARAKIMNPAEMCNIGRKIPVIPFAPIPIPAAASSSDEDMANPPPTVSGNIDIAALAAELAKLGATFNSTPPKTGKKRRMSSKPVFEAIPDAIEKEWKASPLQHRDTIRRINDHQKVLRTVKEAKCGVENAEEFAMKTPPSVDEVRRCEEGHLTPHPDDFRLDFNPGYRASRWNSIVLGKIVDATIVAGNRTIVVPVPQEWLLEKLKGQLNRAQEAWARIQPRKNETPAEAMARANQYQEYRADYTRVLAAKTRKYDACEKTIIFLISLKSATKAPDLDAWKRILEMLKYLGHDGMSEEEEVEKVGAGGIRRYVFQVKVYVWRAEEVGKYLRLVDSMEDKIAVHQKRGNRPLPRERNGGQSISGAPKGLPACFYDATWIKKESEASPVFYEDLEVSEEAFYLLAASADMVE